MHAREINPWHGLPARGPERSHTKRIFLLTLLLALFAAPAIAGPMRALQTRHYTVYTDTDDATAHEIALYMDDVFAEYASRLSAFPPKRDDRSTLYLFEAAPAYHAFLDKLGFDARHTSGVFFSRGGETGLATFVSGQPRQRMLDTLRHEGFHQFAHSRIGRNLPIWVNEGLAEYFGNGAVVNGQLRVGFAPSAPLQRVRRAVDNAYAYSFDELLSMTTRQWGEHVQAGGPNASLLYDQTWLMTHFLIHAEGGRYASAFEGYLKLVANGTDSLDAFAQAFGAGTTDFETAWTAWLRNAEPDPVSTASERVDFLMRGIDFLDEQGVRITSVTQLKRELRRRAFAIHTSSHGIETVTSSMDEENFEAPPAPRARLELVPQPDTPPIVRVTGLEIDVTGRWKRDPRGNRVVEIVYR